MSKMTKNGVSTTTVNGQFQYETFRDRVGKKERVQWDYRDLTGKLHSGIAKSVEEAKTAASAFGYKVC